MRRTPSNRGLFGMHLDIDGKQVVVQEKIGDGGFGAVYKCLDTSTKLMVVKILTAPDNERMEAIRREVEYQKLFTGSTHIVQLLGSHVTSVGQFLILLEYCDMTLVEEMNRYFASGFSSQYIATVFASVLHAVIEIHDKGIIHRDLKPENVLSKSGVWKLCDFGSCTKTVYDLSKADDRMIALARDDIERNTTPCYRAPEMVDFYRGQVIDQKSDIWALGCLLFKMCTFKDAFPDGAKLQILNGKYDWNCCKWPVDDMFKLIVAACFRSDPATRPTAREILQQVETRFKLGDLTQPFSELMWSSSQSQEALSRSSSASAPLSAASSASVSARSSISRKPSNSSLRGSARQPVAKTPVEQYTEIMLMMKPMASDILSDESDIEMDEEHVMMRDPSLQDVKKDDDEEFEFEDDEIPTPGQKTPAVIDVPVTIEGLIDLSTNPTSSNTQEQATVLNLFDLDPPSAFQNRGDDDLLSFDFVPTNKPVEQAPSPRQEIHDIPPAPTEETPKTVNDALRLLFEGEEQKIQQQRTNLVEEMRKNPRGLGAKLISMDDVQLNSALNQLLTQSDDACLFLLSLIHESGIHAVKLLRALPSVRRTPLNDYLLQRKAFSAMYPMFEGNFSLNDYTTKNRSNLPPPGTPPISAEVVQALGKTMDALLVALKARPCQILAEDSMRMYQIMAYIIAKLKQFKVNTAFLDSTIIPQNRNYHGTLLAAFQMSGLRVNIPPEPFNYDDVETQQRLRPPIGNNKYE